jgi:hypothetical protein
VPGERLRWGGSVYKSFWHFKAGLGLAFI